MRALPPAPAATLLLAVAASLVSGPEAGAAKRLNWSKRLRGCEPPAVFYSSNHQPCRMPCCPVVEGVCAGGSACPASGTCAPGGPSCVPRPIATRPNVILLIADDQGECHWGTAGECRSTQTGTPIPPPSTPNLDLLSGYGTVFPIAHNTASWCFPSLDSILTGRYARSYGGGSHIADRLTTIPKALRSLGGTGNAPAAVPRRKRRGRLLAPWSTTCRSRTGATPARSHASTAASTTGGRRWRRRAVPSARGMSRGLHLQPVAGDGGTRRRLRVSRR
jgi:hypothetical protein